MEYAIDVVRDLQKAKVLYEFLKQRNCRNLIPSSLHYCVRYNGKPSRFYIVYESNKKELKYRRWCSSPHALKIISLKDFIKQQEGVITL